MRLFIVAGTVALHVIPLCELLATHVTLCRFMFILLLRFAFFHDWFFLVVGGTVTHHVVPL